MSNHIDFEAWRCCHDDNKFCPPEGCPKNAIVGGKAVPYGCARDHGWKPGEPSPAQCQGIDPECAAPFLARGGHTLTVEFQRRMDIAHEALAALSPKESGK